ncbi:NPCBM/NEW2 domain-containing protein [Sphingomonas sp. LaA6.9]|uniref:NPCBM/NEW2 domain-containing protein n=1 Tax=Sphingomonas sp. LaA6.9 TaxID=2919914 RepID=UPI001F50172D|nr:NPCBM/NEW2 domain-containing protein [Sphingomonas sp. LaA6.9]MCJ8157772.1 NPCBM/NEW2 domain-containing protein [Sphingomonas sp. LaA6.9]
MRRTPYFIAMRQGVALLALIGLGTPALVPAQPAEGGQQAGSKNIIWLDALDLTHYHQRRGRPEKGKSLSGKPITMSGVVHSRGIGSRSIAELVLDLRGQALRFRSTVGLDDFADDKQREGSVRFQLWADEKLVADSGVLRVGDASKILDVDLRGARTLTMRIDDGGDTSNGDIANWGDAMIEMVAGAAAPTAYVAPAAPHPVIALPDRTRTQLHGPRVVGATPGKPFLYRIGATGPGTFRYRTRGLPKGLVLDSTTGIISGAIRTRGKSEVTVSATGSGGTAERRLTILAEPNMLARTPPMGWNSWNVWGTAVDDAKVRAAADRLVSSGLAAHGFDHVVLDDAWTNGRNADGSLKPNEKFPDMKALVDYVHSKGLKFGIYSSPGPKTCGGYEGSYGHVEQDAATFASWGVDFLKYDWCSYDDVAPDRGLATLKKPYDLMGRALAAQNRDIIFSLCQYGYGDVWAWGGDVGGHLWRTTGDLLDSWSNLDSVGFRQAGREEFVSHGRWNDTDMLVLGTVGWGPNLHPTNLTPDEQILHMTLWAMQAAPLFIGADLSKLDDFTMALLTNDEVLEVDRDALAKAGGRVWAKDRLEIWSRPLADGTIAVALFNRGLEPQRIDARWSDLARTGPQPVRDLWKRADLGVFEDGYGTVVPSHGAVLLKVGQSR